MEIAMSYVHQVNEQAEAKRRAYIDMRQQREAALRQEAADALKEHAYTALVDLAEVQVWRCARPGTSCYAFDIMMTRYGIAVVGDIANLTFTVGLGYGVEFLAGKDIEYYIHSKLDEKCRAKEFDEHSFRRSILNGVCERIIESATDEGYEALPDWVRDEDLRDDHWDALLEFVDSRHEAIVFGEDAYDFWDELNDRLYEANNIGYIEEAHQFMLDHHECTGLGVDWYENRVDKASENLIRELYMINHAAKAIVAQMPLPGPAAN
jgi:hypothetical protein